MRGFISMVMDVISIVIFIVNSAHEVCFKFVVSYTYAVFRIRTKKKLKQKKDKRKFYFYFLILFFPRHLNYV